MSLSPEDMKSDSFSWKKWWKKFRTKETWTKDRSFPPAVEGFSIALTIAAIVFALAMTGYRYGWLSVVPLVVALVGIASSFKSERARSKRWYYIGLVLGVISLAITAIPPPADSPTVEELCEESGSSVETVHQSPTIKELCEEFDSLTQGNERPPTVEELCREICHTTEIAAGFVLP